MKKLILLIGLLALTGSAYAGPASVTLVGFSAGGWQSGYPYFATVDGGPVIDVMCDDWFHGGLPGQTWQANYTKSWHWPIKHAPLPPVAASTDSLRRSWLAPVADTGCASSSVDRHQLRGVAHLRRKRSATWKRPLLAGVRAAGSDLGLPRSRLLPGWYLYAGQPVRDRKSTRLNS